MKKHINRRTQLIKGSVYLVAACALFFTGFALAGSSDGVGIGKLAQNITGSFEDIGKLMIAISYVAGIAFAIASIFKFKQHKDNPTQIPLGTPLALLVVGIILVFLPALFEPAGETIFGAGDKATAGGFTGGGLEKVPGGKGGGK